MFLGGQIPLPLSHNILRKSGRSAPRIHNPNLITQLLAKLDINGIPYDLANVAEQESFGSPLDVVVQDTVCIPPGETVRLCASFQLSPHLDGGAQNLHSISTVDLDRSFDDVQPHWKFDSLMSTYILRRNVEYIMAKCTLPISSSMVAVITDHVALSLGWNRDN
jgi:hypothetical protein